MAARGFDNQSGGKGQRNPENKGRVCPALFSSGVNKTQLVLLAGMFWGYKAGRATATLSPPAAELSCWLSPGFGVGFCFLVCLFFFFLLGRTPSPSRASGPINQTLFLWVLKVSTVTGAHSQLRNQSPQQRLVSSP